MNIVISAINFYEGGPLSILKDCYTELNKGKYNNYKIKLLVHRKELLSPTLNNNIEIIQFPKSRKSYLFRIYYEYIYFLFLSKKWNVKLWVSLHDISPNVRAESQAVYCHNPSPFRKIEWKELFLNPIYFLFTLFYKLVYRINIHANKHVIVQQEWLKKQFIEDFGVENSKIIVANPSNKNQKYKTNNNFKKPTEFSFFFPSLARPFKNFEIICKAVQILNKRNIYNFKVYLTLDGTENKYANYIFKKYKFLKNIEFIGVISRDDVFNYYTNIDVLIFPSKLESWGLPISEFKEFNKPIVLINKEYAYETLGNYDKVNFFDDDNKEMLANLMQDHISGKITLNKNVQVLSSEPKADNWEELFNILLN